MQETVSEHMAHTMYSAELAKQAADKRKSEVNTQTLEEETPVAPVAPVAAVAAATEEVAMEDELPSRGRQDGESKYARIGSFDDEPQDPELAAAIMNRSQGPKQGQGDGEDGPPMMNSGSKAKPGTNTDVMALAKQMEKGR